MNNIVATPLVAKVTDDLFVSVPAMYAFVVEQVIVTPLDVLLKTEIASPSAKVEFGMVIEPPEPT